MSEPAVQPWIVLVLCSTITVLAGVVAYLFRFYNRRLTKYDNERKSLDEAFIAERVSWASREASWAAERESLRADYEQKYRELVERHDEIVTHERDASRAHEDAVRKEFADVMARVASEATKSSSAIADMLDKIRDRLTLGPRVRY